MFRICLLACLTFFSLLIRSDEWKLLSESEKKEIGLSYDDDGEFWYETEVLFPALIFSNFLIEKLLLLF